MSNEGRMHRSSGVSRIPFHAEANQRSIQPCLIASDWIMVAILLCCSSITGDHGKKDLRHTQEPIYFPNITTAVVLVTTFVPIYLPWFPLILIVVFKERTQLKGRDSTNYDDGQVYGRVSCWRPCTDAVPSVKNKITTLPEEEKNSKLVRPT